MRGITNYLKPEELKPGYLYDIYARNSRHGIWLPQRNSFLISRVKFTSNYLFEEIHWDCHEHYGTVKPTKEIEKSPFNHEELKDFNCPNHDEVLKYLNSFKKIHPKDKIKYMQHRFKANQKLIKLRQDKASEEEIKELKDAYIKESKELFIWLDWDNKLY